MDFEPPSKTAEWPLGAIYGLTLPFQIEMILCAASAKVFHNELVVLGDELHDRNANHSPSLAPSSNKSESSSAA